MSSKDALEKFYLRQMQKLEKEQRPKRKNAQPEAQLKREVMAWLKLHKFSCDSVESKAVYSARAGRYLRGQTTVGVADIIGVCPNGLGCFIELKAPGRRSTLREGQRAFLSAKIAAGAFAVCIDSIECLATVWDAFQHRHNMGTRHAIELLIGHLPSKNERDDSII